MTYHEAAIASILSNIVAIFLLLVCWKEKRLGRIAFSMLFISAAVINWNTAQQNPGYYLGYEAYAVDFYKRFIMREFSNHVTGYVSTIACCQLLIGLGFLSKGVIVKAACIAATIFLLSIIPLGLGAAFPFSLIAAGAIYILYRYDFKKNILLNKWWV